MTTPPPRSAALLLGLCLAAPLAGCKGKGGGPLARAERNDEAFAHLPVPPADGPKLWALEAGTPVYDRPSTDARKLGEIRVGAAVSRSRAPVTRAGCDGGWFAVRPRGFVCAGPGATLDPGFVARGIPALPDLARPLPYRYARAKSENVPVYARTPTPAEQLAVEPDLRKLQGRAEDRDALGAAANDVPLDARGVPTGPPVLVAGGEGIEGGKRTAASFFGFGADALAPSFATAAPAAEGPKVAGLRKGSGVALGGALAVDGGAAERRFGVTADGRMVPLDRMRPTLGSTWHGIDLDKVGLPVAFVHKPGVTTFSLAKGKAIKHDDEIERRAAVPLTGKFRTVEGVRYEETREGAWLKSQDLVVIVKRHKFPEFVHGQQKWLDVSIASQTLTAYEGTKPVYATLVSTGRDQLKDPAQSASTARGSFRVVGKHVTQGLDPREVQGAFDVADAPWVMDVDAGPAPAPGAGTTGGGEAPAPAPGFQLAGMYWGDGVGEAQTFHAVAMTPIDAHRLWGWADPQVPEGWHAVYAAPDEATTMVYVRP
jgi:L,D-transpeptidase catalytic domain